jgi:hypothetical protein
VATNVTAAFAKAGRRWRELSALSSDFEQHLCDESVDAVFIDYLDRMPKKLRRTVLDKLSEHPGPKIVWATVTVLDEDDFDLESADPLYAEGFAIVVDVPCCS